MADIRSILRLSPVIPVVTLDDADAALPLAEALLEGGLHVVEITLRTTAGLKAIETVAKYVPGLVVGAGTVLNAADFAAAGEAGAAFAVAPGLTSSLLAVAREAGLPFLPGVATASEIMLGLDQGFDCFKFFPASANLAALKAFAGPFGNVAFCATGGVTPELAPDILALPNILCVGATWVASEAAIAARDWKTVSANARHAAGLRTGR